MLAISLLAEQNPPPSDVASNKSRQSSYQSSHPANHLRSASNRHPGEAGRRCGLLWSDSYRTNGCDAIAHQHYRNMSVCPGVGPLITASICQCWIISAV